MKACQLIGSVLLRLFFPYPILELLRLIIESEIHIPQLLMGLGCIYSWNLHILCVLFVYSIVIILQTSLIL